MQHQLLSNNPFNESSSLQDGIEMHSMTDTSLYDNSKSSRVGYVTMDEMEDNVVYAEQKNQYKSVSNQIAQSEKNQQQMSGQNYQQQQQGNTQKLNYPQLQTKQQQQQPAQGVQNNKGYSQQYASAFPPSTLGSSQSLSNQNSLQQQNNPQNLTNSQILSSQFGMNNISEAELEQQIQLQQKILEDIKRSKLNPSSQKGQMQQAQQNPQQQQQMRSQIAQPQSLNQSQLYSSQIMQQPPIVGKMEIKCTSCHMMQRIPVTSKKFQCFNCCTIQEPVSQMPIYSMFVCGKCSAKVIFEPGASEFIQCTRCQQINNIGDKQNQIQLTKKNVVIQQPVQQEKKPVPQDDTSFFEQFQLANLDKPEKEKPNKEEEEEKRKKAEEQLEKEKQQAIEQLKISQIALQKQVQQQQMILQQQSMFISTFQQQQSVFSSQINYSSQGPQTGMQQPQQQQQLMASSIPAQGQAISSYGMASM